MTFTDFLIFEQKNKYSEFWIQHKLPEDITEITVLDSSDTENIRLLYNIQKAIANFVRILTRKDIPVKFIANDEAYTDGKSVTLTSYITDSNIDSLVGLALHEASHILLTDFFVIKSISNRISGTLKRKAFNKNISPEKLQDIVLKLLNWIEDRRIDWYVYTNALGYQGYYHAMYSRYFNSTIVNEMFLAGIFKSETINSYMFHIINMFNRLFNVSVLAGLPKIVDIIDLNKIDRLRTTMDSLHVAMSVAEVIVDSIDIVDDATELHLTQQQLDALKSQDTFINGNTKKEHLTKDILDVLRELPNESDSTVMQINVPDIGEFDVLFIKKISIDDSTIPFLCDNSISENITHIKLGYSDAKSLIKKLHFFNDFKIEKERNLNRGYIDSSKLYKIGFDGNIFYDVVKIHSFNMHLHVSIDLSSSMMGTKLLNVIRLCAMLFKVTMTYKNNMKLVISGRASTITQPIKPLVAILYNSDVDTKETFTYIFNSLTANGYTPDGLCFPAIRQYIKRSDPTTKSYFINISDGEPYFFEYTSYSAANHTLSEVNKIRLDNVKVLSYYISDSISYQNELFDIAYGKDAKYILPGKISNVADSLNRLFRA